MRRGVRVGGIEFGVGNSIGEEAERGRGEVVEAFGEGKPQAAFTFGNVAGGVRAGEDDCEITAAQFKELENATKGLETVKSKPRVGTAEGSGATKQVPVLFRRARSHLRRPLDRLMVPFMETHPDFYAEYKAARKIVNQAATRETKKTDTAKAA